MTLRFVCSIRKDSNFNSHAHVERDGAGEELDKVNKNFNSHAHVERDLMKILQPENLRISTHTLTWSVTWLDNIATPVINDFNSHAHVERDVAGFIYLWNNCDFNSHAHVERDVFSWNRI